MSRHATLSWWTQGHAPLGYATPAPQSYLELVSVPARARCLDEMRAAG